jgi:Ca2+-binding RTX toxin-like protein
MLASHLTASLTDGVLAIEGTVNADRIDVRQDADQISVFGIQIQTASGPVAKVGADAVTSVQVVGLGGNDLIRLNRGTEPLLKTTKVRGGAGDDILIGSSGDDALYGEDGHDVLRGNPGNDRLDGGPGNDQLIGGRGNDRFQFDTDTNLGMDTLDESGGGVDTLDFSRTSTKSIVVNLAQATLQTVNSNLKLVLGAANTVENAIGGSLNDRLRGNALSNIMNGGPGYDLYRGLNSADRVTGAVLRDSDLGRNILAEDAPAGSPVAIIARLAHKDSPTAAVTYSLPDDSGGRFRIDAATGAISLATSLDREVSSRHSVLVRAKTTNGAIAEARFAIHASDVNEFGVGAIVDRDPAVNQAMENAAPGATVGIAARARDNDATNNTVAYSLDDDADGRFAIDARTGAITVNGDLDFESSQTHSVTIRATSTDGSFAICNLTIEVGDVDEYYDEHGDETLPEDFTTVGAWSRRTLTYGFAGFTNDMPVVNIRAALQAAFALWSDVTRLTFIEAPAGATPDMVIRFAFGNHGDGSSFDGGGGVLAHAFFPPPQGGAFAGDVHFDDAELWADDFRFGSFDLVTVAAHEIGHALGLGHSTVRGALMAPTYSGPHRFLHDDDIAGIQSLYGVRDTTIRYEGVSPITAMIPYNGGFLTAFTNVEGIASKNRIHWSPDDNNLGSGPIVYEGISPVTAMIPYNGGVLTAFTNVEGIPSKNRIHWSPDGNHLGSGEIRYEGVSPVTAMTPYAGGVLTAFTNVAGIRSLNRVHWSPDGRNLGGGEIRYEGISPVTAITAYAGGVLTAFTNVAGIGHLNRIHWSPNGQNLGSGEIRYEGVSPVTAMTTYQGGVLTGFTNVQGIPSKNRIHWSPNGAGLGSGPIRYEGVSPVEAIAPYGDGVLSAFSNCEGDPNLHRIHWSPDGNAMGG